MEHSSKSSLSLSLESIDVVMYFLQHVKPARIDPAFWSLRRGPHPDPLTHISANESTYQRAASRPRFVGTAYDEHEVLAYLPGDR